LFTEINDFNMFVPKFYKLNLTNFGYTKVFPSDSDETLIVSSLSSLSATQVDHGIITHNNNLNKYLIAYSGLDNNVVPQPFVTTFTVTDWDYLTLTNIDLYKDNRASQAI